MRPQLRGGSGRDQGDFALHVLSRQRVVDDAESGVESRSEIAKKDCVVLEHWRKAAFRWAAVGVAVGVVIPPVSGIAGETQRSPSLLSGLSKTHALPAKLVGRWTRTVTKADVVRTGGYDVAPGSVCTLTIKADGFAKLVCPADVGSFEGRIVPAGIDRVRIDLASSTPNVYRWQVTGRRLTFTKQQDSDNDREAAMEGVWTRTAAAPALFPAQLVGRWTRTVTATDAKHTGGIPAGTVWTLTIKRTGAASVSSPGVVSFAGSLLPASADRVDIKLGFPFPDAYQWRLSGPLLTFTKVSDRIAYRAALFSGIWKRK